MKNIACPFLTSYNLKLIILLGMSELMRGPLVYWKRKDIVLMIIRYIEYPFEGYQEGLAISSIWHKPVLFPFP